MAFPIIAAFRLARVGWWVAGSARRKVVSDLLKEKLKNRKKFVVIALTGGAGLTVWVHYCYVPISDRGRIIWLSDAQIEVIDKLIAARTEADNKAAQPLSPNAVEKFQRILNNLIENSPELQDRIWTLSVIQSDVWNAFSYQSGALYIHTGLLSSMKSDDELAFVIGHEMAHVLAKHTYEVQSLGNVAVVLSNGLFWLATFISPDLAGFLCTEVFAEYIVPQFLNIFFLQLPYKRKQEIEADYIGAIIASRAGYNPSSALDVTKMMLEQDTDVPNYLRTHPAWKNRLYSLEGKLNNLNNIYNCNNQLRKLSSDAIREHQLLSDQLFKEVVELSKEKPQLPKPVDSTRWWKKWYYNKTPKLPPKKNLVAA